MIQIYKKREFGELISDTFNFFKEHGKNYFKNYIIINGLIVLLLVVVFVFSFQEIFAQLFNSNLQGQRFFFEQYFAQNQISLIISGVILFVLLLLLSFINYSFPVFYLKRLAETGKKEITSEELLTDIRKNAGKFFKFFLGMLITMLPIMIIAMLFSALLMMIVIGIFLFIFMIPVILNIINFTFFDYFNTQRSYFDALREGFRIQFSAFWKYFGSTVIIYIVMQVVSYAFTILPMSILMGTFLTVPDAGNSENFKEGTFFVILFIIYFISIVLSLLLSNIIYVNSGLMYYDSRKDLHRSLDIQEIDSIGTGEI